MPPPPAPADAFSMLTASAAVKTDPKKALVSTEMFNEVKAGILKYAQLSKVGLVEILSAEFKHCTKNQIKNTVEALAERSGKGSDKTWKLKDGLAT